MKTASNHKHLYDTVVANGFCIGCGACSVPANSPFKIRLNDIGIYQAELDMESDSEFSNINYEKICPFGTNAPNETTIAKALYENDCNHDSKLGFYNGLFAGHVTEGDFRSLGSSGGMGTWILNELLSSGEVDYIIHVQPTDEKQMGEKVLFKYSISAASETIQKGSKSQYYPIELSEVLATVKTQPGRYALIGLPCFIKSVRLLQLEDKLLSERIKFCIGLVCGHLKSSRYAESLAWQMDVEPSKLVKIDFRVKNHTDRADNYSTSVVDSNGDTHTKLTKSFFGTDWGIGSFKYKACDFCDDVFAETADLVLGDAWLPEYIQDGSGTNIVITRNSKLLKILNDAMAEDRIKMDLIELSKVIKSQDAGLRHRRSSLPYRALKEREFSNWVPIKRFSSPVISISKNDQIKQDYRSKLRSNSHASFENARRNSNINFYINNMTPIYNEYVNVGSSVYRRIYRRLKIKLKNFFVVASKL